MKVIGGGKVFSYKASQVWNCLPAFVKDLISMFKYDSKHTYLLRLLINLSNKTCVALVMEILAVLLLNNTYLLLAASDFSSRRLGLSSSNLDNHAELEGSWSYTFLVIRNVGLLLLCFYLITQAWWRWMVVVWVAMSYESLNDPVTYSLSI